MVGAPDVVQPWMPRVARDSDACLWHVSIAGGARRRGCAAAGVSVFLSGPLDSGLDDLRRDPRALPQFLREPRPPPFAVGLARSRRARSVGAAHHRGHAPAQALLSGPREAA